MASVVVGAGQSLWSIAKKSLPAGAPEVDVKKAAAQIAAANGIAANAPLQLNQRLVIPDAFVGLSTSPVAADALARLSTTPQASASGLSTRLGATARPLLDFKHVLVETPTVKLGSVSLPQIAGKAVAGEVHRFEGVKGSIDEAAFKTTNGVLGKLTETEFDAVHAELGGHSPVKFDAEKNYTVRDFLPPTLQALVNKDLDMGDPVKLTGTEKLLEKLNEEGGMLYGEELTIGLTSNCHAAAYEAVRAYQGHTGEFALFYGEMMTMDGLVVDEKLFEKVGTVSLEKVEAGQLDALFALDLKPGDVVQFHEEAEWGRMTMLLHSAVYVGGGLFFEKPNTEGPEKEDLANYVRQDETPFRLATIDDMAKPIHGFVDGKFRMEVVRAKEKLADPAETFGSSLTPHLEEWATKKGRSLGAELVVELEQGMGGNIRAEHASGLVRVGVHVDENGGVRLQ